MDTFVRHTFSFRDAGSHAEVMRWFARDQTPLVVEIR